MPLDEQFLSAVWTWEVRECADFLSRFSPDFGVDVLEADVEELIIRKRPELGKWVKCGETNETKELHSALLPFMNSLVVHPSILATIQITRLPCKIEHSIRMN